MNIINVCPYNIIVLNNGEFSYNLKMYEPVYLDFCDNKKTTEVIDNKTLYSKDYYKISISELPTPEKEDAILIATNDVCLFLAEHPDIWFGAIYGPYKPVYIDELNRSVSMFIKYKNCNVQ